MNTQKNGGFALVATVVLTLILSTAAFAYVVLCQNEAHTTQRVIDYQKAQMAAEAGMEYGVMCLKDMILAYEDELSEETLQYLLDEIEPPDPVGNYVYEDENGSNSFRIIVDGSVEEGVIDKGTACYGQLGKSQQFKVVCGARNPDTGVKAALSQELQSVGVYMIRFGVFYENDLEILPGPEMVFSGPVHGNSDLYLDANSGPLRFYSRVTSHEDIYHRRKDEIVKKGTVYINNAAGTQVKMVQNGDVIDSEWDNWMVDAIKYWNGQVLSQVHGVPKLDPPINPLDDRHDLIERPLEPTDPEYDVKTEKEKFANKAGLLIHIDAANNLTAEDYYGVDLTARFTNAILRTNGLYKGKPEFKKNGDGTYKFALAGAYDITQENFYDGREERPVEVLDIYVDELIQIFPELCDGTYLEVEKGRGIVYVTRDLASGSGDAFAAVRLRNGRDLPDSGLTIASDMPIYVEGDYNVADSPNATALVAGDTVSFLSKNWQDARSTEHCKKRSADATTYNTVIMTGNTETELGSYNGGLENVLRFLEQWSGKTCKYRGSVICLWYSETVTGPWEYGNYYTAPKRDWGYDEIYLTDAPPGMPRVFGLEEIEWSQASWADAGELW